jgi:FkbM family methyltransferase
MTKDAEIFKSKNHLNYESLTMKDFNNFPLLSGIYKFTAGEHIFDLICIKNDDSSVVDHFWKGHHDKVGLDLWSKITKKEGIFIDVGSHTGLYTIVGLLSHKNNFIISIEPSYINLGRMKSNLRLNNLFKNNSQFLGAASNFSGQGSFMSHHDKTFMAKGGKIASSGETINVIRLDDISTSENKNINGIKIDTEGEDYKVLLGAENTIKKYKPHIIIETREYNKIQIYEFLSNFNYKFSIILDKVTPIDLLNYKIENSSNIYASVEPLS